MNVALQPPKEDRLIVIRHISLGIMIGCTVSSTCLFQMQPWFGVALQNES